MRWARRKLVAIGIANFSANDAIAAVPASDHRLPPRMKTGRSALATRSASSAISAAPGEVSIGRAGATSATATRSTSMSSGSAITTGPGRPLVAMWKARETISGTRAGSSISVAHLVMVPNTAR